MFFERKWKQKNLLRLDKNIEIVIIILEMN